MQSSTFSQAALIHPRVLTGFVVLVALIRFVNLGFPDLQAWDEGLYALRSASIVHSGQWLDQTPYVPGGLATSCYPPLTFWTSAALFTLFGANEWTTRLTSAFCGAGSVLLIVLFTRRFVSHSTALLTGLLFGTNLFYTFYTRQGQLDSVYIFFLLMSLYGWSVWYGGKRTEGLVLIALGTWGAFMSKILVGFYVPLILLLAQSVLMRRRWQWKSFLDVCVAVAVGILLASPWHVFMYAKYGGAFIDAFLRLHLFQRVSSPIEGHNPALGVFFYINQVVVQYPEASLGIGFLLLFVSWRTFRSMTASPLVTVACVWGAVVFAIITVMATKIQQYMLPLGVPVAILGGYSLSLLIEQRITGRAQIFLIGLLSVATLWSALWPLREFFRSSILGIAGSNPYITLPWGMIIAAVLCTFYGVYLFVRKGPGASAEKTPVFVGLFILLLVGRLVFEVVVADRTQYDVGTGKIAALLEEKHARRVMYLGKDLNPALDVYLKGWDQWRTDIRLDQYLCESTALAPNSNDMGLPGPGEVDCLVEERRIEPLGCFPHLAILRRHSRVCFDNLSYRVYDLSAE